METGEGDHVDGQFTQISVELTRESETSSNARHGGRDQMVQVTVGWGGEFEGTKYKLSNEIKLLSYRKQIS